MDQDAIDSSASSPELDARPTAEAAGPVQIDDNFIPAWLAVVVVVLLIAVMALGGYVVRGFMAGDRRVSDVSDLEVNKWREQVKANPSDLEARVQLGYAYQQGDEFKKALKEYDYVLRKDPTNTGALFNKGVSYLQLDLDDKAEQALWQVLKIEPDHVLAAKTLGEIYVERKQYKSVIAAVRPVAKAHPEMADLQYLMGVAYENTGHGDWAIGRYKLALQYAPDLAAAREGLRRLGVVGQ